MKVYYLFFAYFCVSINCEEQKENSEKPHYVLDLNKNNFRTITEGIDYVLIHFFDPDGQFTPFINTTFPEAAETLTNQGSPVKFAQLNKTRETEIIEKLNITEFPHFKFFMKGVPHNYTGGISADQFVKWCNKKLGPPTKVLKTVKEAKDFIGSGSVILIGFFEDKNSANAKEFLKGADEATNFGHAVTYDEKVKKEYGVTKDCVILFRDFDEKAVYDGEIQFYKIVNHTIHNCLPPFVEFLADTVSHVFNKQIKENFLVFLSKEAGHHKKYIDPLVGVARKIQKKRPFNFLYIDLDYANYTKMFEKENLTKEELPKFHIFVEKDDGGDEYYPDFDTLEPAKVEAFIQDYLDEKLEPYKKSEDLPKDWNDKPVKVLVRTNFDEVALNKEKDVLVEFYAPWCGYCQALTPVYEELAEKYKDNKTLIIAKIDATANDLTPGIQAYPTLKMYKKKTNEVEEYNGPKTLEAFSNFIEGKEPPKEKVEGEADDEETPPKKDEGSCSGKKTDEGDTSSKSESSCTANKQKDKDEL